MLKTHGGRGKLKNPFWNQIKVQTNKQKGYRIIHIKPKTYYLHRINYYAHNPTWDIHNSSTDNSIDHENKDKTNNHIENLRVLTHRENLFNTNSKGYSWNKLCQKWTAQIGVNGKKKHLGCFDLEEDARTAYLEAKKIYHNIK